MSGQIYMDGELPRDEAQEVARVLTGLGLTVIAVNLVERTLTVRVPPPSPRTG